MAKRQTKAEKISRMLLGGEVQKEVLNQIYALLVGEETLVVRRPKGYWTKEECHKEALKYKSRGDFIQGANGAYQNAKKHGWMDDVCSHMPSKRKSTGYWTEKKCSKEALKYQHKNDFREHSGAAYVIAQKSGWLDQICEHMNVRRKPSGYWNKERCKAAASPYSTRTSFQNQASSAYNSAYNNGWLNDICMHMVEI